jgi:hypothetical protein
MPDEKLTIMPTALILGLSIRRVDQLANASVLPFETVKTSATRIMKVFKTSDVEAYKQQREAKKIALSQSKEAA